MASVWTLAQAQRQAQKLHGGEGTKKKTGLYGPLERMWQHVIRSMSLINSKLFALHRHPYATVATNSTPVCLPAQSCREFGVPWSVLANAAAYQVFTAAHPSQQYQTLCTQIRQACESTPTPEKLRASEHQSRPEQQNVSWYDLVSLSETGRFRKPMPEVVSTDVLDCLPDEDYRGCWMSASLCSPRGDGDGYNDYADECVRPRNTHFSSPAAQSWWVAQLETAGSHHPEKHWQLIVHRRNAWGRKVTQSLEGGRRLTASNCVGTD